MSKRVSSISANGATYSRTGNKSTPGRTGNNATSGRIGNNGVPSILLLVLGVLIGSQHRVSAELKLIGDSFTFPACQMKPFPPIFEWQPNGKVGWISYAYGDGPRPDTPKDGRFTMTLVENAEGKREREREGNNHARTICMEVVQ